MAGLFGKGGEEKSSPPSVEDYVRTLKETGYVYIDGADDIEYIINIKTEAGVYGTPFLGWRPGKNHPDRKDFMNVRNRYIGKADDHSAYWWNHILWYAAYQGERVSPYHKHYGYTRKLMEKVDMARVPLGIIVAGFRLHNFACGSTISSIEAPRDVRPR